MSKALARRMASNVRPWRRFRARVIDECADRLHDHAQLLMKRPRDGVPPPVCNDRDICEGSMMAAASIVRGLKYKAGPDADKPNAVEPAPKAKLHEAAPLDPDQLSPALFDAYYDSDPPRPFGEAGQSAWAVWREVAKAALAWFAEQGGGEGGCVSGAGSVVGMPIALQEAILFYMRRGVREPGLAGTAEFVSWLAQHRKETPKLNGPEA